MAKRKDEFSFGFTSKKKEKPAEPPADAPTEGSADTSSDSSSDPFATSSDTSSSDPFATSSDTSSDPFATPTDTSSSDPFATPTDTATADPSADPFATPAPDASADPFATSTETPTETPADASAEPAAEEPAATATEKTPRIKQPKQFRILVLADFSGRTNRGINDGANVGSRKAINIDADSFEKVMGRIKPQVQLPVDEKSVVPLSFGKMEDFRPDALLANVEAFQALLKLREDLKDSKKFKAAAAAVRKLTGEAAPKKPKAAKPAPDAKQGDSDFERLLNQPIAPKGAAEINADALIANLVAGYSIPDADPQQGKLVALVEDALSAGLRAMLRHPACQALESSWRGVEFLTSRLSTDEELKIAVLDISKDELYADLSTPPTIEKTGMYQLLVEQTRVPGTFPFSLIVADYEFEQAPRDIALLAKIASLMHAAEIPFVAGATAKVTGFPTWEKFAQATSSSKWAPPADAAMWDKIRGHKLAPHIGLTGPRFLLRLPYGPKTDAIETYSFDEMPADKGPVHDGYLWGNGAFAVAHGIGQAFLSDGWGFTPSTDLTDLPCHMAMVDGDKEMTPCAEIWISDRTADILHQLGIIPLLSVKNAPSAKIAGVHSIARGGKPLAAAWATA